MNQRYLLALDQGTTSSRAVLFTKEGQIVSSAAFEFPQHYPQPGWVEHDPQDILTTQIEALRAAVRQSADRPAGDRRHRHHQPARDHAPLGPADRPAGL